MKGMAKQKATLTIDRAKLAEARALLGAGSASAAVDMAISEVIRRERLRRDIEAYAAVPSTDEEVALGQAPPDWTALADDTDWDADWPEGE